MLDMTELQLRLKETDYIAEKDLVSTLLLTTELKRPLLLEGDAGVGKTEIAKALSKVFDCPLIRLQCYEGLDVNSAVYEWNYQHQLLTIKLQETVKTSAAEKKEHIFSEKFLLKRPLLKAITQSVPPVLLIDEIDRADEEFEAFLLEVLSEFQISIPELGTIQATTIPHVILTSNGTRELSDALRRRCLYHYINYPSFEKELKIVNQCIPDLGKNLASQVVAYIQELRKEDLRKKPGIGETLDWVAALMKMNIKKLDDDPDLILSTLVCLLKTKEDRNQITEVVFERLVAKAS